MPTGTILLLGAFAGLTIFLGLPLAFLKQTPHSLKIFLNMLATGVLIFLLFDVVSKASDPINAALDQVRTHQTGTGTFSVDVFLACITSRKGSRSDNPQRQALSNSRSCSLSALSCPIC